MSQKAVSKFINLPMFTNSAKFNPYILELYISGTYNGVPASEANLYVIRAGCTIYEEGNKVAFIYIGQKDGANNIINYQTPETETEKDQYHKVTSNGLTLEFISRLSESPYNWNNATDDIDASTLTARAFNINYSPTIKALHVEEEVGQWKEDFSGSISELDTVQKQFQFVTDNGNNKVAQFIKELYISSKEIDLSEVTFTIFRLFKYTADRSAICCGLTIKSSIIEGGWYFEIPGSRNGDEYTELVGSGYYCFTTSNGINFEFVVDWENNPYNFIDTMDSVVVNRYVPYYKGYT